MDIISLLGDTLRQPNGGSVPTAESVASKSVVALYFSAHWCPPCRGFTPDLAKRYTALKTAGKDFEMVFVSSDRDAKAFDEYHATMPFLALPFDKRDEKEQLSKMFKVEGIPTLVFVDVKTGTLINDEGRKAISADTYIENFPYHPKPFIFKDVLGDTLRQPGGNTVSATDSIANKAVLALYFSAHWCPPCRGFTPQLCEKYAALKEANKDFEMIFVSSDRDAKAFDEYHASMPFLALPFDKRSAKEELSDHYKVGGIPTLVFVDAITGKVITTEGRDGISSDTFVEDFPYHPKPVNDLGDTTSGLNEDVSLIILMETATKNQKDSITEALTSIAGVEFGKSEDAQVIGRFYTGKGGGPLTQIRSGCGYKEETPEPVMLILNLDDSGAYYHPKDDQKAVTKANIESFITAFRECSLDKKTFSPG